MKKLIGVCMLFVMLNAANVSHPAERKEKEVKIIKNTGTVTNAQVTGEKKEKTGKISSEDIHRSSQSFNIDKKKLQSLPVVRDPWAVLDTVPGILLERVSVGGGEPGRQSLFTGAGASEKDTTWYLDGVTITHPETIGTAPAYIDVSFLEEVQVSVGGHDITAQTGGTQLNFVTRKGGSRFSGGAYFSIEDETFEMNRDLPASITDRGLGTPGIFSLYRYGGNVSGPIIKDKLWFSGSYAMQDIHARTIWQTGDKIRLPGLYGKLDFRFGNTSGSLSYAGSSRRNRDRTWLPADSQDPASTWDQGEPFKLYAANIRQVFGDLTANLKAAYTESRFTLDPAGCEVDPATGRLVGQDWFDYMLPNRYFSGSLPYYNQGRKSLDLSLDCSYFSDVSLPGDHEIRFGVDYYAADTSSQTLYPNQRKLFIYDRNNPQGTKEIWWVQDGAFAAGHERLSFYFSDTITYGRLSAGLGIRFDRESGSHKRAANPALTLDGMPIFTPYISELWAIEGDVRTGYRVFSPRVSVTYDIKGNGTSVLKASYAGYGSFSGSHLSRLNWDLQGNEIDVYWNDKNGDLVPQVGEWDEAFGTWVWWNVDPYDPYAMYTPNTFDKNYNSPLLDELTLSYEKSLGEDVTATLNAVYKKQSRLTREMGMFAVDKTGAPNGLTYAAGSVETADNWYKAGTWTFADGKTKDNYERYYIPNRTYLTNYGSGTYNTYKGLQLIVTKKLSHGWMADISFTLSDWKSHIDPEEFFDKTNFDYFNGGAVALESGAYDMKYFDFYYHDTPAPRVSNPGLAGMYVNSRWQLKLAGLVQLPFGINLTGLFHAREGHIIAYYDLVNRSSGLGWTKVYEPGKKLGDDRLPAFLVLNLGLEKTFNFSSLAAATLFINGYNITNNAATLQVDPVLGTSSSGQPQRILNPGIFQFGVRVDF